MLPPPPKLKNNASFIVPVKKVNGEYFKTA